MTRIQPHRFDRPPDPAFAILNGVEGLPDASPGQVRQDPDWMSELADREFHAPTLRRNQDAQRLAHFGQLAFKDTVGSEWHNFGNGDIEGRAKDLAQLDKVKRPGLFRRNK